ncbi:MAG: terminase large subunit [Steroidobacteraceae bacterium]|jgi:phage terminase large subunit-like protein
MARSKLARWRADPIKFIEQVLINPETKKPFVLLEAERTFLKYAFATGEDGRLLYPEQIFACPKKSGKTTFAAIYAITMVLLFGGSYAEVICAANDHDQAMGRVFAAVKRIVECSPLLRAEAKITANKITIAGAAIGAIPSNYASAAGSNPVLSIFDELWAYRSERLHRLFDELVPPPTRQIACRLTVTYAGFTGESALLEELYHRGLQQPQLAPNLYAGEGTLMFWSHEPIAPWQTDAWKVEMRRRLRPNQYLRMIENRFVRDENNFIDMALWDECTDPRIGHMVADKTLSVWAAVDASTKHDSTALAAVTWSQQYQQVRLVDHYIFTPSTERPVDFSVNVEQTLREWSRRFNLRTVWYDPYQMAASSQRLLREGLPVKEYPQTVGNLTAMGENLFALIKNRNLLVYPDREIRTAVSSAVAVEGARGWKIAKDKQSHRIDIVVALGMAALACVKDQGEPTYDTTYAGFQNGPDDPYGTRSWQDLRTALYLQSGGTFRLW